jgi:hypothetical protein
MKVLAQTSLSPEKEPWYNHVGDLALILWRRENPLPLLGIELQFLGYSVHVMVTNLTEMF